ncbi:MAG TPA: type II secretion system protein [bacterium]|nr:type II secretion system protein [bacterium]
MLARLIRRIHGREAGFTLIELMIVILVILILAAILVPQFGLARERARKAACVSNQRNLETAVAMWSTDNPNTAYAGGTFDVATPSFGVLTGSGAPQYTLTGAFIEPDAGGASPTGSNYYLSNGIAGGAQASANQAAPTYGHVACAYDGVTDPWVNNYDTANAAQPTINHTRGAAASP